uniref:DUF4283 domain-containing protein n=2 Tax=Nicotiana TaxID=4085 RepID=A0A1S3XUL7_TOBAC|nr:PREDICTED: uncharacterized protein LOC104220886 [Nicotiana sylvestris]XP_016443387.1 PREDICTED: uncharacterized protein LOC107768753 [Nicotiana tabacum]
MGPWFIFGHFLSVQKWEPNFLASEAKISKTAVWIRLPQLPTEFYDSVILQKIGNKIGKLLKVDACTSSTLRGRYARLCVELPLNIPVAHSIYIGSHKQSIHYEDGNLLCVKCGRLGHVQSKYNFKLVFNAPSPVALDSTVHQSNEQNVPVQCANEDLRHSNKEEKWETVIFPTKNKANQRMNSDIINDQIKPLSETIVSSSESPYTPLNINHSSTNNYAKNSSISTKTLSPSPNLKASKSTYYGQPSDSPSSPNDQPNILCPIPSSPRSPAPLLDRASFDGACNIIQHDTGRTRDSYCASKLSLPCRANIRGDAYGNEQLLQPCMVEQQTPSPSSIHEL